MSYNYRNDKLAMGGSAKRKKSSYFSRRRIGSYLSAIPVAGSVLGGLYRGIRGYTSSKKGGWAGIRKGLDKMSGYRKKRVRRYGGSSLVSYKSPTPRIGYQPSLKFGKSSMVGLLSDKWLDLTASEKGTVTSNKIKYFEAASIESNCRTLNLIQTSKDTINDRIGPRVYLKKLDFSAEIDFKLWDQATPPLELAYPTTLTHIRMIIYIDKFSDGTENSPNEILADSSSAAAAINSDYDVLYNKNRFIILRDKVFTYDPSNLNNTGIKRLSFSIPLGIWADYYGVNSTNWCKNSLKIMMFHDYSSIRDMYYLYNMRLSFYG